MPGAGIVPTFTAMKIQPDIRCATGAVDIFMKIVLYVSNPTPNPNPKTIPTPNPTPNPFPNSKPSKLI